VEGRLHNDAQADEHEHAVDDGGLQNEDPARYVAQCRAPQVTRALAVHDPTIWQQWFKPLHLLPADVIEQLTSDDSPTS
jgi:hypothetical protein